MNPVERLLANLAERGLTVKASDEPGKLLLSGPSEAKTPQVMETMAAFKSQIVEHLAKQSTESLGVVDSSDPSAIGGKWIGNQWHPREA